MKTINNHHEQVIDLFDKHFGLDTELKGIEIGTAGGGLTKTLLLYMKNLELFTIDPWMYQEGEWQYEAALPQEYHDRQKAYALKSLAQYKDRCMILEMKSDDAIDKIPCQVDFVWIDGNHSREQVKRDILNYKGFVREGGIIGGHDYGLAPDVKPVVDDMFGSRVCKGVDFTWWVVKE